MRPESARKSGEDKEKMYEKHEKNNLNLTDNEVNTPEEIQNEIDHLTKELYQDSKHNYNYNYDASSDDSYQKAKKDKNKK